MNARPQIESIKGGYAHDISEYVDFDFYTWVKYQDVESFPQDSVKLGRWLGIAHLVGSTMTYYVLKDNRKMIHQSTVRPLANEELHNSTELRQREVFDKMVVSKFGSYDPEELDLCENDEMSQPKFETDDEEEVLTNVETEIFDNISATSQERNAIPETERPEGNDSDRESIVNEETSV